MNDGDFSTRRFYAVGHEEENTKVHSGTLIPAGKFSYTPTISTQSTDNFAISHSLFALRHRSIIIAAFFIVSATFTSWATVDGQYLLAAVFATPTAPAVVIENPYTGEQTPLNYGINVSFTEPNFFQETRRSFIENQQTFIEVDLTTMSVSFFETGTLKKEVSILTKGERGSWWETPAGLYNVTLKKERHFSSFGQVYTPWTISFSNNLSIHGWPTDESGEPVSEEYVGGRIRLADADAKSLYELVSVATPVLVYEKQSATDNFVYEPKIPELDTPHYLIADVKSSTVLASSDLDTVVPIASITKLMTALVATENLDLDSTVNVTAPTFVQSLIPRLGERNRVSMYSLLQLLLMESSNEASEIIASQLDREVFIELMNEKATAIGMNHTVFTDPSGLSSGNVSTVRDLLRLVQYIEHHRRFILELTRDQYLATTYTNNEFGKLTNFNLIKDTDNFLGGKIGETSAAGQTSVTLHTITVKGQERVVAIVVLGSNSRNEDVLQLLSYATDRFSY